MLQRCNKWMLGLVYSIRKQIMLLYVCHHKGIFSPNVSKFYTANWALKISVVQHRAPAEVQTEQARKRHWSSTFLSSKYNCESFWIFCVQNFVTHLEDIHCVKIYIVSKIETKSYMSRKDLNDLQFGAEENTFILGKKKNKKAYRSTVRILKQIIYGL